MFKYTLLFEIEVSPLVSNPIGKNVQIKLITLYETTTDSFKSHREECSNMLQISYFIALTVVSNPIGKNVQMK